MGDSHTFIDSKAPYYNSHCLNKDTPGLIKQINKAHRMESMLNINKQKELTPNINFRCFFGILTCNTLRI